MIEQKITEALQRSVIVAVSQSLQPTLPIKMMGRTLSPNPDRYLEVIQIVNNIQNSYWGQSRVYQGILRLILHWEVNDEGVYEPMKLRDSIASFYMKEDRLWNGATGVQIVGVPDAGSPIEAGGGQLFPVSIPYRCFER
jgi:hypothetical protein